MSFKNTFLNKCYLTKLKSLLLFHGFLFIHVKFLFSFKLRSYKLSHYLLRDKIHLSSQFRYQQLYLQGIFASLHRTGA
jgi:hypothetical protein